MKDPERRDWAFPVSVSYVSLVNLTPFVGENIFLQEIYDMFYANLLMIRCGIFMLSSV